MEPNQSPNQQTPKRQTQKRQTLKLTGLGFLVGIATVVCSTMAYSYSEEPQFCGGCHAMTEHYVDWQASNHRGVNCSECHLPNDGLASHLVAKAETGLVDVYAQTVGDVPLNIEVTVKGKEYLQDNCLRCHAKTVENTSMIDEEKDCTACHRKLVHDVVN